MSGCSVWTATPFVASPSSRQDAYGLFLDADSDRRMEVLSALLGLDIYGRMEDIAKASATEQRRTIAALKERINVLGEQISEKE